MNQEINITRDCDIETFGNALVSALERRLGDGFKLRVDRHLKNNSVHMTGIVVLRPDCPVSPQVYIDTHYQRFLREGGFDRIVNELEEHIRSALVVPKIDTGNLILENDDFSRNIFFRLINREKNKEMLANSPHRTFLDLAVTYRRYVDMEGIMGSIMITGDIADSLGLDEEELFRLACENTPRLFPINGTPMVELLSKLSGISLEENPLFRTETEIPLYVVSNTKCVNGASSVLYREFPGLVRERFDCDVFILPSSVHELILLPANGSEADLLSMVREINRSQVPPEDFLSDNIYRFCLKTGEFLLIEESIPARDAAAI